MENEELRAYFFQNMYLQSIHAGIQSQHCTAELFVKYLPFEKKQSDMLYDWANNHKTSIVLNGGYAENLYRLVGVLDSPDNPYPWAYFCESEEALGGVITNVGIILPKRVFDYNKNKKSIEDTGWGDYNWLTSLSTFEEQLVQELSKCRLMN